MSLLWELEDFKKICQTFKRFSTPFMIIMFSLYSVLFFYAVIGEFFFGALITTDSVQVYSIDASNMYYLINFNDMYASMVTLFHVLVVNNWNETTEMYTVISESNWPRVYFTTFWVICTLIMLNIVISFVLEIYGSIGDEVEEDVKIKALARQLMLKFKDDPNGEKLAQLVQDMHRRELRMKFGLTSEQSFFNKVTERKDLGERKTGLGRRNSI